jgi:hypothetical protein
MGRWLAVVVILGVGACGAEAEGDAPAGDSLETSTSETDGADAVSLEDSRPGEDAGLETSQEAETGNDAVVETDTAPDLGPELPEDAGSDADSEDLAIAAGAWTWSQLADLPRIIQEHAVVALAGEVVMLGGFENLALIDDVTHFDPATGQFREGTSLPRALHHVNAAVVDGRLWVLGALEGFAFSATGDVWVLDVAARRWESKARMEVGRQRGSSGVAVVGGDVYLVGGFRGGAVDDVDVYRSATDTWERVADLPAARDHGGAQAIGAMIYTVGGRRGGIESVERDLWRFDTARPADGWVAVAPMPTARGGFALGVVRGQLVVVGGEGNDLVPSGVFAEAELYDPAADRWFALPSMPAPRHGMQAVAIGDTLFVPGGADVEAFGATARFSALTLE